MGHLLRARWVRCFHSQRPPPTLWEPYMHFSWSVSPTGIWWVATAAGALLHGPTWFAPLSVPVPPSLQHLARSLRKPAFASLMDTAPARECDAASSAWDTLDAACWSAVPLRPPADCPDRAPPRHRRSDHRVPSLAEPPPSCRPGTSGLLPAHQPAQPSSGTALRPQRKPTSLPRSWTLTQKVLPSCLREARAESLPGLPPLLPGSASEQGGVGGPTAGPGEQARARGALPAVSSCSSGEGGSRSPASCGVNRKRGHVKTVASSRERPAHAGWHWRARAQLLP